MPLTRAQIIDGLRRAIEPIPEIVAMALGGSRAFGRDDDLSDVDVQLIVEPGFVADAFAASERGLAAMSPIVARLQVPEPAWHGHSQRFYQLRDASVFHHVDLFVAVRGRPPALDEVELHGEPVVLFDKAGAVTRSHVDRAGLAKRLSERRDWLAGRMAFFHCYVDKEIRRGHPLAALHFYQGVVLAALVEVLRIRYSPCRHDWGVRYAHVDLPPEVTEQLTELSFVSDLTDLEAKYRRAVDWFTRALSEIESE